MQTFLDIKTSEIQEFQQMQAAAAIFEAVTGGHSKRNWKSKRENLTIQTKSNSKISKETDQCSALERCHQASKLNLHTLKEQ